VRIDAMAEDTIGLLKCLGAFRASLRRRDDLPMTSFAIVLWPRPWCSRWRSCVEGSLARAGCADASSPRATASTDIRIRRIRFPPDVIMVAICSYITYGLSHREVENCWPNANHSTSRSSRCGFTPSPPGGVFGLRRIVRSRSARSRSLGRCSVGRHLANGSSWRSSRVGRGRTSSRHPGRSHGSPAERPRGEGPWR
jgi:hypothetical protein